MKRIGAGLRLGRSFNAERGNKKQGICHSHRVLIKGINNGIFNNLRREERMDYWEKLYLKVKDCTKQFYSTTEVAEDLGYERRESIAALIDCGELESIRVRENSPNRIPKTSFLKFIAGKIQTAS